MKIAIFSASLDITSGYGNITYEFCKNLKSKVDFTLFLPKTEPRHNYADFDIKYILPKFVFSFKTRKVVCYLFLPKINDLKKFDVIHSLFAFPYCLLAARFAKKYAKPLIIGAQGTYGVEPLTHWPERYFLTRAYNQANFVITPSRFTKEKIKEFSKTQTEIKIIHNGVDFSRFQEKQNLQGLKKTFGDKKTLLTIGGLKARKGQDIIIKALAKVKPIDDKFHYFIIGEGEGWKDYLKKLTEDLGLSGHVSFLGNLTGKELVRYFQFCDIYIHTPRNVNWNFEGFGIVYLEAGACKKPIIATDSGGIRDAVIENKTGLIVSEEDIDGVAGAILKLFQNSSLAQELGENGFKFAREHDWSLIVQKFLETYSVVLSKTL